MYGRSTRSLAVTVSELRSIADRRIDAKRRQIAEALPTKIENMMRRQSADGMLRSGNSVLKLQEICIASLEELAAEVQSQYLWVASTALFLTSSASRALAESAPAQLQPFFDQCRRVIAAHLPRLGGEHTESIVHAALEAKRVSLLENIGLEFQAKFAERSRSVLRNLGAGLGKIFGRG